MIAPSLAEVASALRLLADFYAAQAAEQAPPTELVAQKGSPLGNRRHIAAVRRRVAAGLSGASIVGRRYLLTSEALAEELGTVTVGRRTGMSVAVVDELAPLRARLEGRAA